jgi:hypothetical protein
VKKKTDYSQVRVSRRHSDHGQMQSSQHVKSFGSVQSATETSNTIEIWQTNLIQSDIKDVHKQPLKVSNQPARTRGPELFSTILACVLRVAY